MFACNVIFFNHESPIRGETFVNRKITPAVARIKLGIQKTLYLGNLDSKRGWDLAKDYLHAMWQMLQQDQPDDYVISTGETHAVCEFVEKAFKEFGILINWEGKRINEVGIISEIDSELLISDDKNSTQLKPGDVVVRVDPRYFRHTEVDFLLGDASKARKKRGWEAQVSFDELIHLMIEEDLREAVKDNLCNQNGFPVYNHPE